MIKIEYVTLKEKVRQFEKALSLHLQEALEMGNRYLALSPQMIEWKEESQSYHLICLTEVFSNEEDKKTIEEQWGMPIERYVDLTNPRVSLVLDEYLSSEKEKQ